MGIRNTLLVKVGLPIYHSLLVTTANARHRYPRGKIRMIINLPYVEGTSKKLKCILRSHKIKSMFYTKSTLRKLLCKSKDQVATKDKKSIICKIECSNCEEVSFDEYKWSLKIAFRLT